jgi:hypothetical protein
MLASRWVTSAPRSAPTGSGTGVRGQTRGDATDSTITPGLSWLSSADQWLDADSLVFRGCHGEESAAVVDAMRSNYETGRPAHPADLRATVLHMAVSMFEDAEVLRRLGRRRPDRMGTHLARVELQPGRGICLADTGGRGHWSVWGIPAELAACVVDVVPLHK